MVLLSLFILHNLFLNCYGYAYRSLPTNHFFLLLISHSRFEVHFSWFPRDEVLLGPSNGEHGSTHASAGGCFF